MPDARAPMLRFTFDGRPLDAPRGASVASALMANGISSWRRTRSLGAARGLLCGIGSCFDCLVDVGDAHAVRACLTPLQDGDAVRTSASLGSSAIPPPHGASSGPRSSEDGGPLRGDVLVIGGGPAGLSAADAAVARGVSVVLVDNAHRLGGQLLRQPSSDEAGGVAPLGPRLTARYPRLAGAPALFVATGSAVWQLRTGPHGVAGWLEDGRRVEATAVVLAPGATELVAPFPGWDLPGVVTAGGAQALLSAHDQLVGRRLLVAGSGPLLFAVAAHLADAGADVLGVVEALPARRLVAMMAALARYPMKAAEAATYIASLGQKGVGVRTGSVLARCEPGRRGAVSRAVVVPTAQDGHGGFRPWARRGRVYDVDAVCISFGFVPRLELARQLGLDEARLPDQQFSAVACDGTQATSVAGVFAAGEVTGIAGGEAAALEGAVAGASAAAYCKGDGSRWGGGGEPVAPTERKLLQARRFAGRLARVYRTAVPLELITDETVICRCEDVRADAIFAALAAGAATAREVRNVTRCGMGYCQGRTCGPLVQLVMKAARGSSMLQIGDFQKRPVVSPVTLEVVARSALPERPGEADRQDGEPCARAPK